MKNTNSISLDTIKENIIKDYEAGLLMKQIAAKYKIGLSSISCAFKRWDITANPRSRGFNYKLPISKDEIKRLYEEGQNITQIAKLCGAAKSTIWAHLKNQNYEARSATINKRKYSINENYFEILDSEEKAYWLGFLCADGCNKEDVRTVELTLSSKDRCVIEAFKSAVETEAPIDDYTDKRGFNYSSIRIYNEKLSQDLAKLGCVKAKTKILTFPNIDEKYYPSFLLGYFDGDGCVSHSATCDSFEIAGTEEFLIKYQEILMKSCGFNKTKLASRKGIKIMRYGGKQQLRKIFNFLYMYKGFKLDRKFNKFKAIIL